ncbi:hypothetical protein P7C70_g5656, partial [Phenoliferia sp. Uapishka_3]
VHPYSPTTHLPTTTPVLHATISQHTTALLIEPLVEITTVLRTRLTPSEPPPISDLFASTNPSDDMPTVMNSYNPFETTKLSDFGSSPILSHFASLRGSFLLFFGDYPGNEVGDFSAFLDSSFTDESLSLAPLFADAASSSAAAAPSFTNAFRTEDSLLESPLGLSPTSPFDFAFDYTSPMLGGSGIYSSSIDGLGTPELTDSNDLPSLFYSTFVGDSIPAPAGIAVSPIWSPIDAGLPTTTREASPDLAVSPQMMRLDSTTSLQSSTTTKKRKTSDVPPVLPHEGREPVKDKFTGVRNTKIKPIDFTAPTMSRQYVIPSVTSRRKAPAAITAKITGTKRAKVALAREETPFAVDEEGMDPDDLPDELLSAIEQKRRSNTLAARRSRMRKAGHIQGLQDEIDGLKVEVDDWKKKYEDLLAVCKQLRGDAA